MLGDFISNLSGANPTTFEFTVTILKLEENIFVFKTS
jgi:hypothetical protein